MASFLFLSLSIAISHPNQLRGSLSSRPRSPYNSQFHRYAGSLNRCLIYAADQEPANRKKCVSPFLSQLVSSASYIYNSVLASLRHRDHPSTPPPDGSNTPLAKRGKIPCMARTCGSQTTATLARCFVLDSCNEPSTVDSCCYAVAIWAMLVLSLSFTLSQ